MKKILGLDLGTNSIGWSLVNVNFKKNEGQILGLGSRIIPMSQDVLSKFDSGTSISQTAERTGYRGTRRLYQRDNLRRERLHRVLNILGFLPEHYAKNIDFEHNFGQFKKGKEPKINYKKGDDEKYKFIFIDSFFEMAREFELNKQSIKIPFDWTIYFLRKKALSHKISKEELAWVILNFNQKRGYYQLRGEDENTDDKKIEKFYSLKVKDVQKTSDKNARGIWYNIVLENDWVYKRQSNEPLYNWIGKEKEFIITTTLDEEGNQKLDKEGNVKRSFRAVDSEKDWIAIKTKTEQDIELSKKTVGQFIYETLLNNPKQKIRGKLVKTIERKFYKKELNLILKEQVKHHPELKNRTLYDACIEELYPRNEAHQNNIKNKSFEYLFINDIIFYQRPLKSKKSTISNCKFESRVFNHNDEKKEQPLKSISKSHPLFQEFRLLQFLDNLKIYKKEMAVDGKTIFDFDVTTELLTDVEAKNKLLNYLMTKEEIDQNQLLKFFSDQKLIPKQKKDNTDYRWNYPEEKKYPCFETRARFLSRIKKIKSIENSIQFLETLTKTGSEENANLLSRETQLWHIIYSIKDKTDFKKALGTFANKNGVDPESFVENFIKYPPFKNEYGAYSEKALKKLLPLMRFDIRWNSENIYPQTIGRIDKILTGEYDETIQNRVREKALHLEKLEDFKGLPLWLSEYIVYDRHSESSDGYKWNEPTDIDKYLSEFRQHSLRNPIVEQVVTETLRVVRDIWIKYGERKKDFFDEIHIELGREMKNTADKRKNISLRQYENENTNYRIKQLLKEMRDSGARVNSPSHQEILKIYEEGIYHNTSSNYQNITENEIEKIRKNASPSKKEIERYKLWLEQGYLSPYTGEIISLSKLFSTEYQIEHIIPQSRYFDNSLTNKVICESVINPNPYKDNQTGFEFIKNQGGSTIPELSTKNKTVKLFTLQEYESHCKRYFSKNKFKLEKLLSEDIPLNFINRQLNDSRYISKLIKGLLSNIVREEEEQEVTSKNIVAMSGIITSKLKHEWGLNDKWNELIQSRFIRLNKITNTQDFGFVDNTINAFRIQVPENISKGFNKKRIDHRHHALDALVIACTTKNHVNYLTNESHVRKNKNKAEKNKLRFDLKHQLCFKTKPNLNGKYNWQFKLPWQSFPVDAKKQLEKTIISFKQNTRVINKTNNKTWQWVEENGQLKKKLVKQTKGDNWAIRKSLHKETISGMLKWNRPKDKIVTASRISLSEIKNKKHLEKITDSGIQQILINHLENYIDDKGVKNYDLAFNSDGIEDLNKNIVKLNNNKFHQPIYKVRVYEIGTKFAISADVSSPKNKKYVEAAKGTNLFFAIYWNEEKQKREYETIPLNEVLEHQKWRATLPKEEMQLTPMIPINFSKGRFLFSLSPNDLVYVPTTEEIESPHNVNFDYLTEEQVYRIYKMVSCTKGEIHFLQNNVASLILPYNSKTGYGEFGSLNKSEKSIDDLTIKKICLKLQIDRLGNVIKVGEY